MKTKIIDIIAYYSNEDLIKAYKEITVHQPEVLSDKTQKLFSLYDNTNWLLGIDRISEIATCIESCILVRIRYNKIDLK